MAFLRFKPKKKYILLLAIALCVYPVWVLGYVWVQVLNSPLDGGRNGPLDAYRHTLASAVVSFTLSPIAVQCVTAVMERGDKPSNLMDRHNNRIGAAIGSSADSFFDIEKTVAQSVRNGVVHSHSANQTTWLPKKDWLPGKFW
jgi:hypothetical protein